MWKTTIIVCLISIGLYYFEDYMNGCEYTKDTRIDGKVAIVTGANSGIGKQIVLGLAKRGGKVYMACRSLERGQVALEDILQTSPGIHQDQLVLLALNLSSLASIKHFVTEYQSREFRLDILVNNGASFTDKEQTEDGFDMMFGSNHLGHFLLTNLLVDLLVTSSPSRVVTMTSGAYKWTSLDFDDIMRDNNFNCFGAYCQSKLANLIFSKELGTRLEGSGVTTYSVNPGGAVTDYMLDRITQYTVLQQIIHPIISLFMKNPWQGAQTTFYCALDESLQRETGHYYNECSKEETSGDEAQDPEVALRLWDLSVHLLKLQPGEIHPLLRERPQN